jgi:hypothetical protein
MWYFMPGCTGMHYVTRRFHWMQKHIFGVTCIVALFVESVSVPHKHEKWRVSILCIGHIRTYYVTRRSQWMQKHKFRVTCPAALFMETTLYPPEHEK